MCDVQWQWRVCLFSSKNSKLRIKKSKIKEGYKIFKLKVFFLQKKAKIERKRKKVREKERYRNNRVNLIVINYYLCALCCVDLSDCN